MNNENFTAQELLDLQKRANEVFNETVRSLTGVKNTCVSMSNVVLSEDSNLASKWSSLSETVSGPITTASNSFSYLETILNSYVNDTVSNEQSAESGLDGIDTEISALGSAANSLVDLGSAVGGLGGATAGAVANSTISPNGMANSAMASSAGSVNGNYAGVAANPTGVVSGNFAGTSTGNTPTPGGSGESNGDYSQGGGSSAGREVSPGAIYAPPTPSGSGESNRDYSQGGGSSSGREVPPGIIYAPPTPSGSGENSGDRGGSAPPSVIYAPPTPNGGIGAVN